MWIAIVVATILAAQSPAFEVASVRPSKDAEAMQRWPVLKNGNCTAVNVTLRSLLSVAYGFTPTRITGPDWLDTDRFDIAAKAIAGTPDADLMPMLQALLRDRFRMELHREEKDMPAYDLVVAKGGAKLALFDPAHPPQTPPNKGGSLLIGVGTPQQIADSLAREADRPVVDRTGIEGRFVFIVNYARLASTQPAEAAGSDIPDFFTAVQQQLGLRLESRKQPIEILVVDRAARVPTGN